MCGIEVVGDPLVILANVCTNEFMTRLDTLLL